MVIFDITLSNKGSKAVGHKNNRNARIFCTNTFYHLVYVAYGKVKTVLVCKFSKVTGSVGN